MRDIFTEIFENQPLDPREAARRGGRPALRKRFYSLAHVGEAAGAEFPLLLDGKPVKTPARRALAAPNAELAEKIAAEWNAQRETIDPARMPLTRLANAVIDAVKDAPGPVAAEIANYLGADLLCYRAEGPDGLVERQRQAWDPVLAWARDALGARFVLGQGVMHVAQPDEAIAAARTKIPTDPWALGALSVITTLTGSACWRWPWPKARSMPRPFGPPRKSTKTGRWRNGAAITTCSNGAPPAAPSSTRR